MKNKAIFIDRDGTLNKEVGYPDTFKKIHIYKRSVKALKLLRSAGFKIIVVSNQAGVAYGYFTEKFVRDTHNHIAAKLKKQGAKADAFYFCPHHAKKAKIKKYKKDCACRKPKTGMVKKAAKRFSLNIGKSYVVGDKLTDVKLGINSKMKSFLVLTGFGKTERKLIKKEKARPDFIVKDLYEAAKMIISLERECKS